VITNGDFVINDDFSYAGKMETSLTEGSNPYYAFRADSTHAKSLISGGISGKDIVGTELINSAQFRTLASMTVDAKKPAREQAGYIFWEIPVNKSGVEGWRINYLLPDRTSPFELPATVDEEYSYTITIPGNSQLVNPVEMTEMESEFGSLVLSTQQKGNKVTVKRMLIIRQQLISPEEYKAFKEMMDLWNDKNYRQLVLKKAANP
jgi:hypothetical protein